MSGINPQLLKPWVFTEGKHSDLFNKSVKKLLKPTVTLPSHIEEDVYKEATKLVNSGENLDIISTDIKGAMGTPIALAAAVRSFPTVDYLLKNGATPIVSLPPSLLPESLEETAASKQIQEQMSKTQELRSKILSDGEQAQKNFSENKNPESAESFKVFQDLAEGGYNLNAPFFNGEDGESKFLIGRSAGLSQIEIGFVLINRKAHP